VGPIRVGKGMGSGILALVPGAGSLRPLTVRHLLYPYSSSNTGAIRLSTGT